MCCLWTERRVRIVRRVYRMPPFMKQEGVEGIKNGLIQKGLGERADEGGSGAAGEGEGEKRAAGEEERERGTAGDEEGGSGAAGEEEGGSGGKEGRGRHGRKGDRRRIAVPQKGGRMRVQVQRGRRLAGPVRG